MKKGLVSVKNYHLAGDGVKIVFSMEDPDELELVYEEDKQGERRFSGRAIYREKTVLGFLVSVVLEDIPDLHRIMLSLAVPSANRLDNMKSIPVKTFAVRTTNRTSIGGQGGVEGQIQTYETMVLDGNAW